LNKYLVWKREVKTQFWGLNTNEDIIKMDRSEIGFEHVNRIKLAGEGPYGRCC
jgi:hypothetical protein